MGLASSDVPPQACLHPSTPAPPSPHMGTQTALHQGGRGNLSSCPDHPQVPSCPCHLAGLGKGLGTVLSICPSSAPPRFTTKTHTQRREPTQPSGRCAPSMGPCVSSPQPGLNLLSTMWRRQHGQWWQPHTVSHTVGNRPRERPRELLCTAASLPPLTDRPDSSEGRTIVLIFQFRQ